VIPRRTFTLGLIRGSIAAMSTPNTFTAVIAGVTYTGTLTSVAAPPAQVGLKVVGTKLIQPDGTEFRIRGVNRFHFDSNSIPGIVKGGANAVRIFITQQWGAPTALAAACQAHVTNGQIVIPALSSVANGSAWDTTSGSTNAADAAAAYAWWAANAALFAPMLNGAGILNPLNEWGPANSQAWASAHIAGIPTLRTAGYTGPILVDCGGSGQDELSIANYAKQVLAADPLGNTLFAYHLYGGTTNYECPIASVSGNVITLLSSSATHPFAPSFNGTNNSYSGITQMVCAGVTFGVSQNVGGVPGAWTVTATSALPSSVAPGATLFDWGNYAVRIPRLATYGVCVAVMEFGPGLNVGASPTLVTPQSVVSACESVGLGWCPWAWDDNNEAGGLTSPTGWFGMTLAGPGIYNTAADLTPYGQIMVPLMQQLAKPSTVF